jgi:hypothetical protein
MVDGKTYQISIGEISSYESNAILISLQNEELVAKINETVASPIWLGVVRNDVFYEAKLRLNIKEFDKSVQFLIESENAKYIDFEKIIVYTSDHKLVFSFDSQTKEVLPALSDADIELLFTPELCKTQKTPPLTAGQNKAGISFGLVDKGVGHIQYSNPLIKKNKAESNRVNGLFFAVDADNPSKLLDFYVIGGHNKDNTEFMGWFLIDVNTTAEYALVGFKGISADESAETETPPLFFSVKLGDTFDFNGRTFKAIKDFCDKPYPAGDIFKELGIRN